jgi:hypothetical protein
VEELNKINIVAGFLKVLLQEEENARFQDEGIVDSNGGDTFFAVPTRLTTSSDRAIHHVISNEEISLQLED